MKRLIYVILAGVLFSCTVPQTPEIQFEQWRGQNRDGKYPDSTLLKQWPENGPDLLWAYDSLGDGYGSPIATNDRVYVAGEIDSTAYIFVFDLQGKLVWKKSYGTEWNQRYPGSRSTPTLIGDYLYVCSGMGDIACLKKADGSEVWKKNMVSDFHGKVPHFGYAESLLVNDSVIYAIPGGKDTNVVALDRFTGNLKWVSAGKGDGASYNSPTIANLANRQVLVTLTYNYLIGLDAANGNLLWDKYQEVEYNDHANTAIFEDGHLYLAISCGNGLFKYKLSGDGSEITQIWGHDSLMYNYMGGIIKLGDKIYGSCEAARKWKTLDANTGELIDSLDFDKGPTIYADSMLYCYNNKGIMGLVSIKNGLELVSSFKIERGTKEHFSHPIIKNGVLYIRHGQSIMAYNIKPKV